MNCLNKFKIYFNNVFLNNKRFLIIPYYKQYYNILFLFYKEGYIRNFLCITFKFVYNYLILIELIYINKNLKIFRIIVFNIKLKFTFLSYNKLIKLYKYKGLFIINTSKGIMTLEHVKYFKLGGILMLYII